MWVPGLKNIARNEAADSLAREKGGGRLYFLQGAVLSPAG